MVVFVYSTRDYNWLNLARNLKTQSVFWETVRRCDSEIRAHLGWSIENDLLRDDQFQISEEHCEPGLTAMQIGLTELWRSRGIHPDAVMGACAGEFAAAYVGGAISLENAMELACKAGICLRKKVAPGRMLLVDVSDPSLIEPSPLYYVSACIGGTTLIGCREADFDATRELLKKSGLGFRQILSKIALHSPDADSWKPEFCRSLKSRQASEQKLPIYSVYTGATATPSASDMDHWWKVLRNPVLNFDAVIYRLIQDGYKTFLEINSHLIFSKTIQEIADSCDRAITVVPVLSPAQSPDRFMEETLSSLDFRSREKVK